MLTFEQTLRLKNRPGVGIVVENKKKQKFRCIGWGKDVYKGEYQYVYLFRQFNTEESPMEFIINSEDFDAVVQSGRIFY